MREFVEINEATQYVNMRTFGFREGGKVGGNTDVFKTYLHHIYSGGYIDENLIRPLTPIERKTIEREIESNKLEVSDLESNITESENEILKYKSRIKDKKDEYGRFLDGTLTKSGMHGSDGVEIFNLPKFIIASFFGIMLSIFIFLFYVAVTYKGLVMTDGDMAKSFANGDFGVNVLPHWNEVVIALRDNLMIAVAPFVFFAFGYAIHIFLEKKGRIKIIGIVSIGLITFLLDYFLALRIHDKMNNALSIMDLPPNEAFEDILIVLILGFVVYVIWSIIFHVWYKELEKRNIPSQIGKSIKKSEENLNIEVENKKRNRGLIGGFNLKLQLLEAKLDQKVVPMSVIAQSLSQFTTGWLANLEGGNEQGKLSKCTELYEDFRNNNAIETYENQ